MEPYLNLCLYTIAESSWGCSSTVECRSLKPQAAGAEPADSIQDNLFVLTNHFMILARNFYSKSKIPHSFV